MLETEDFIVDNNRINVASPDVFTRDPLNLIAIFRFAQANNLALHPDATRAIRRSLRLIDRDFRQDTKANHLFLEILTSQDAETVLRRMNETGVLGRFIHAFGRVVAMMQFNMYHHYTVDEHLLRCIGVLAEIERGDNDEFTLSNDLMKKIQPQNRAVIYVTLFLHDIAKGRAEDHSIAGARIARRICPRLGFSPAETDTVAWLIENHLVMSTIAQSRDLSDRKTIENFAAVVQSLERLKLLTILTTADIRAVGPGVWNGWKAQLLRTLYYETEPVLTGGFSEVNRAQRVEIAQAEFKAKMSDWSQEKLDAYVSRHYPAYWLKVDLPHQIAHARFLSAAEQKDQSLATSIAYDSERGASRCLIPIPVPRQNPRRSPHPNRVRKRPAAARRAPASAGSVLAAWLTGRWLACCGWSSPVLAARSGSAPICRRFNRWKSPSVRRRSSSSESTAACSPPAARAAARY